jgi:cytochrome c oxidase subunit 1
MLLTLGYLLVALFRGEHASENPWDSRGYEWQTSSPPPKHNFDQQPSMERGPYDFHLPSST